jgi:chaperonin cofactor prefoldin
VSELLSSPAFEVVELPYSLESRLEKEVEFLRGRVNVLEERLKKLEEALAHEAGGKG